MGTKLNPVSGEHIIATSANGRKIAASIKDIFVELRMLEGDTVETLLDQGFEGFLHEIEDTTCARGGLHSCLDADHDHYLDAWIDADFLRDAMRMCDGDVKRASVIVDAYLSRMRRPIDGETK